MRVASFLNTAALCYWYVGIVLGIEAGGIHNKIWHFAHIANFRSSDHVTDVVTF
jgi:hypothetical protein